MKHSLFSKILIAAALMGVPLSAADPQGTGSMSTGEAGALLGAEASQFEADVMFDRYCDPAEFIAAVRKVDAEGVVDFVLQLAHGKSILGRERHGLTVDEAAAVALAVATEVGDAAALGRLTAAAERHGLKEVAAKLAAAGKLGGASRGEAPAVAVSVLETDPAEFGDLKDVENHLRVIKLTGDGAHAKALLEYVADLPSLSDEQKKELTQRCSRTAAGGKPVAPALKKLATPVRGCGMDGAWQTQYQAADGSTVDAYVEINGNSGTYSVPGCQGQLYNIRASAPFGGGPMVVQGQWRFCGGETGTFRWSVNGDSFRGYWTFSGGGSPMCRWDGSRDYGGGGGGGGWQPDPGNGGGGGGGFPDPGDGGGGEIDDLLDGDFTSNSGASISVNNQNVQMTTASGMRLLGRLSRYGNGQAQATFQVGGRPRTSTIRVINRNQIQVGNTTFSRR